MATRRRRFTLYIPLLYYSLRRLCADEFTVKKMQGIQQGSVFLQFLFMVLERKKNKSSCQAFAKVLFSNSFSILELRTINVNYLLHI